MCGWQHIQKHRQSAAHHATKSTSRAINSRRQPASQTHEGIHAMNGIGRATPKPCCVEGALTASATAAANASHHAAPSLL